MRKIDTIVIHCSATEAGKPVTSLDIDLWHRHRGFLCIGYHYVVLLDGCVSRGRTLEAEGAHTFRHNKTSIGICYIGGLLNGEPHDTRTAAQRARLEILVKELLERFPEAVVCGHRDLTHDRDCPCFDVAEWASSVGIAESRILQSSTVEP